MGISRNGTASNPSNMKSSYILTGIQMDGCQLQPIWSSPGKM